MTESPRLEAIEFKLAHLERTVADLADVIARQDKELIRLLAQNQRLATQLQMLGDPGAASESEFEKPPHY